MNRYDVILGQIVQYHIHTNEITSEPEIGPAESEDRKDQQRYAGKVELSLAHATMGGSIISDRIGHSRHCATLYGASFLNLESLGSRFGRVAGDNTIVDPPVARPCRVHRQTVQYRYEDESWDDDEEAQIDNGDNLIGNYCASRILTTVNHSTGPVKRRQDHRDKDEDPNDSNVNYHNLVTAATFVAGTRAGDKKVAVKRNEYEGGEGHSEHCGRNVVGDLAQNHVVREAFENHCGDHEEQLLHAGEEICHAKVTDQSRA